MKHKQSAYYLQMDSTGQKSWLAIIVIVGNISDHNRDGRNKVCCFHFHHGMMMLIGRLIVMG
jgi:hypothetical protein